MGDLTPTGYLQKRIPIGGGSKSAKGDGEVGELAHKQQDMRPELLDAVYPGPRDTRLLAV